LLLDFLAVKPLVPEVLPLRVGQQVVCVTHTLELPLSFRFFAFRLAGKAVRMPLQARFLVRLNLSE
jgi:hypothetical protein